MKRPFLVVLLVLALVGIPTAPLAHARVGAPPAWSAADTAAEAGQPQIAIVDQASRLLQDKFFEPIDTADLYSAAVDAANDELTAEKATARIAKPTFGKDAGRNWGLFYDAYMAAASSPGDSIDQKELAYAAIRGMVKSVKDCHTYFMTKEQYQQQLSMLSGNRSAQGIGAAIVEGEDGYIFASDVYAGTPAAKAGLRAGDKFLKVNGEDTKGWKTTELVAKIRERIGQPTQFTIGRPGAPEPIEVTITPGPYKVPDWESKMLDGGVGYFHLYSFVEGFDKQKVQDFYRELVDQGATSIVIDLRNNPGGYVSGLVALLSAMIPKDQPLFRYIARDGSEATSKSVDNLWPTKIPVAFLVNGGSGSAPEIVAAVAQDFGVAKVFGVKTGGCVGTVGYSELADGSALGITTTRIDTAKGRSLNRIGVTPDVVVERSREDLANARDPQLDAATTFLRGEAGNPTVASTGPATPGAPSVPGLKFPVGEGATVTAAGAPVIQGWALMSLEQPSPEGSLKGRAQVSGWAINTSGGSVDEVALAARTADGQIVPLGSARYGLSRPDVAAAVGAQYGNSGFSFDLDATALPAGRNLLTIGVRSGNEWQTYTVALTVGASAAPAPTVAIGAPDRGTVDA